MKSINLGVNKGNKHVSIFIVSIRTTCKYL